MLSPVYKPVQLALVMVFTLLLLAGCSSGSNTVPTASAPQDQSSGEPPSTVDDGTTTNPTDPTTGDVQSFTSVNFDITVPAYSSNALQVKILWGDVDLNASWVGDEQWSASTQLRANTSHQLLITFSDENGEIPLASYEQTLSTGSNDSLVVAVSANQFDSARWDSDNDGDSNLDELLAGTNPLDSPKVLLFSETEVFRHDLSLIHI